MKHLGKKRSFERMTINAYSCYCGCNCGCSCSCTCTCNCSSTIGYAARFVLNLNTAAGQSNYGKSQGSSISSQGTANGVSSSVSAGAGQYGSGC